MCRYNVIIFDHISPNICSYLFPFLLKPFFPTCPPPPSMSFCVCPITFNYSCLCKHGWEVVYWIKCNLPYWGVWPTLSLLLLIASVKGGPWEHYSIPWQNAGGPSLVQSYIDCHCCSKMQQPRHAQKLAFLRTPLHPPVCTFFLPLLWCSIGFRGLNYFAVIAVIKYLTGAT